MLDRPHIPMEVATGKSRKRVDAAKHRKQKQKSVADDAQVSPDDELARGPPRTATRSDDPFGSAEASGPRRKKTPSAAVGIFFAFAPKDASLAVDDSGSDTESTCVGSDRDIIDLSHTSDSEWQCVRDVENKMEIEFEEFHAPPPHQPRGTITQSVNTMNVLIGARPSRTSRIGVRSSKLISPSRGRRPWKRILPTC